MGSLWSYGIQSHWQKHTFCWNEGLDLAGVECAILVLQTCATNTQCSVSVGTACECKIFLQTREVSSRNSFKTHGGWECAAFKKSAVYNWLRWFKNSSAVAQQQHQSWQQIGVWQLNRQQTELAFHMDGFRAYWEKIFSGWSCSMTMCPITCPFQCSSFWWTDECQPSSSNLWLSPWCMSGIKDH